MLFFQKFIVLKIALCMEPLVGIGLVVDRTDLAMLVMVSVAPFYVPFIVSLFIVELAIRSKEK